MLGWNEVNRKRGQLMLKTLHEDIFYSNWRPGKKISGGCYTIRDPRVLLLGPDSRVIGDVPNESL